MIKTYHYDDTRTYIGYMQVEKAGDANMGAGYIEAAPGDEQALGRYVLGEDGGTWIALPAVPAPVPARVTMRQARLALLAVDLLDNVEAAIAAIPDATQRRAAQIEWEYAQTVDRNSSFTQQMAIGLALSAEQLDNLFTQAANL